MHVKNNAKEISMHYLDTDYLSTFRRNVVSYSCYLYIYHLSRTVTLNYFMLQGCYSIYIFNFGRYDNYNESILIKY